MSTTTSIEDLGVLKSNFNRKHQKTEDISDSFCRNVAARQDVGEAIQLSMTLEALQECCASLTFSFLDLLYRNEARSLEFRCIFMALGECCGHRD